MPAAQSYDQAAAAVRAWYERHGRLPSYSDWEHSAPGRPCARTIQRRWGWSRFLAEALGISIDQVREYQGLVWTEAELVDILIEGRLETGSWPTQSEWMTATASHPSARTFYRFFGSWSRAIAAATKRAGNV